MAQNLLNASCSKAYQSRLILGTFSPKRSQQIKYSTNVRGGYSSKSFQNYKLPVSVVTALVQASNQSLALSTWSSYRTAENHLRQCEIDTRVKIRFPMDDRELCITNFRQIMIKSKPNWDNTTFLH